MSTTLDYLIPLVRSRVGDLDSSAYKYADDWLLTSLQLAVRILARYQNFKYLIDSSGNVSRNTDYPSWQTQESSGVIQPDDEYLIALLAAIITLEGSLENSAWNAVAWRDNEISFSNLEQFRTRDTTLKALITEFNNLVLPPTKRLAGAVKGSLPGYKNNPYEYTGKY